MPTESDPDAGKEVWGEWDISAAAYPDVNDYGTWRGPDYGFAQEGACQNCHIVVCGIIISHCISSAFPS